MNLIHLKKSSFFKKSVVASAAFAVASLSLVSVSVSAASNPGFVLYSAQGYDSAAVAAFNATHPGFTVTLNDNSTGPLLQQIQAEGNNPKWGAVWVDGAIPFAHLDTIGMLVKNSIPKTVKYSALGLANAPKDGSFIPTGVTETGVLCYDTNQVTTSDLPNTWKDMLTTQYVLGMNDPSVSGPTFPLIAGVFSYLSKLPYNATTAQVKAAITKGEAFYSSIANKQSGGLLVNATNGVTLGAMQNLQVGMATIQGSACYSKSLGSYPTLSEKYLDASMELPSNIGIDAKMPKIVQQDAEKFAAWVLSPAGQHAMFTGDPTGDSLFWPVIKGENPANSVVPNINTTNPYTINPYVWAPYESQINSWFDSNFVN